MATRREGLRQRRLERGFSQEALALALGVATTTLRGWERGAFLPRVGFRPKLARALDVSLAEVHRWFDDERRPEAPAGMAVPAWLGHFATLEQGASDLWAFEVMAVHGLLQTPDYATALRHDGRGDAVDDETREMVRIRMARQKVLTRSVNPLQLSVVLDESTLYRAPSGRWDVMTAQLDHLVEAATWPNIDLRVLPFSAAMFAFGSFTLFTSVGASFPYMVCVEDRVRIHYLDQPGEIEAHVQFFTNLRNAALQPGESLDFIRTVAKEHS